MQLRLRDNRGETIVEVLISTIVIASTIVGAYVSVIHSMALLKQSSIRQEATSLAEAQINYLQSASNSTLLGINSYPFCLISPPNIAVSHDQANTKPCNPSAKDSIYTIEISLNTTIPNYKIYVHWTNNSGSESNVTLYYIRKQ